MEKALKNTFQSKTLLECVTLESDHGLFEMGGKFLNGVVFDRGTLFGHIPWFESSITKEQTYHQSNW